MTVTSIADPSSNWEDRCRPLNHLTVDFELRGKKNLLQSDWTDTSLVRRNNTRKKNEKKESKVMTSWTDEETSLNSGAKTRYK